MSSNVTIKITADVIDLQAKFAVAKAETSALTSELGKLAKQAAQGGMTDELKAQMTQVAESMLVAKNRSSDLANQLKTASGGSQAFAGSLRLMESALQPVVALLSVAALEQFGVAAVQSAAHIEHEAEVLSLSSTAYQAFTQSARLAGVEIDVVDTALRRFNSAQGAAQEATSAQAKVFRELGVDASLPAEQAIPAVARALLDMTDKARASRLETQLFGRAGEELNPVLEQWARGTDELTKKLSDMGLMLDPTITKAARASEIQLDTAFEKFKVSYTPAVVGLTNAFAWLIDRFSEFSAIAAASDGRSGLFPFAGGGAPQKSSIPVPTGNPAAIAEAGDVARLVDLDGKLAERKKLTDDIATAQNTLSEAQARGDQAGIASATTAIADLQKRLDDLNGSGKASKQAQKIGDELAQVYQQTALRHITAEEQTNTFLLSMGQETLEKFKTQAVELENARYAAELEGVQKRIAADHGNAVALAKDQAEEQGLLQEHNDRLLAIDQQYQEKRKAIQETDLKDFIQQEQAKLAAGDEALATQLKSGQINEQQRHDLEIALTQAIEAEVLKRFDAENAGLVAGTEAYAKAMKERAAIVEGFSKDAQKADDQLTDEESQKWKTLSSSIRSSFNSALNGLIFEGNTFKQFMANVGKGIAEAFLAMGEKMAEDWLEQQLRMIVATTTSQETQTAATVAGTQARAAAESAAHAESAAASAAAGSAQILNDAYKAAAGAYQAVVGIPIVGPILAPVAAGVAFAAVAAFDTLTSAEGGQERVLSAEQLTMLHKDEMVLPARIANPMREFAERGGMASGGGAAVAAAGPFANGGGSSFSNGAAHFHYHAPSVQAMDARDVDTYLRDPRVRRAQEKAFKEMVRRGLKTAA